MVKKTESAESRPTPMRRLTVTIPDELVVGLEDMAETTGGSISEALREAVGTYLMENYWKGVGGEATRCIEGGMTNEETLASVLKKNPGAATTLRSVAWYRSKLRKEKGVGKIPTDAGVRRARGE